MISLTSRSGAFSPYLQATVYAVAGPLKALVPGIILKQEKVLINLSPKFLCRESLNGQSPKTGPAISVSINGRAGVRFAHTDARIPHSSVSTCSELLDANQSSQ